MADAFDVLVDDRALVERAGNIMRVAPVSLTAALVCPHPIRLLARRYRSPGARHFPIPVGCFSHPQELLAPVRGSDSALLAQACWHLLHTSMA